VRAPLSGLAPARRRVLVLLLAGVLVAFVAGAGKLVINRLAGEGIADQDKPGPVLLVPGYGGDTDDLAPLVAALREEGREAVVAQPTGGGTGDLRAQAKRLAELAKRTMKRADSESIDLIGYSAGGVVARLYVRDEGGASVVRRVLTLGSPHHGTDVAALAEAAAGGCPTACEQLATGSDLIRRLNAGDETPQGPQWITVRTNEDTVVTPPDSARLEGALNIEVQGPCPEATTTHGDLPGDPVVLATVTAVLGRTTPQLPRDVTC
jgi:triacylglycerol lipase